MRKYFLLFWAAPLIFVSQTLNFQSRGIGGGGALFSIGINPANTNEYYVSCDMGELFHTTSGGLNYDQVDFSQVLAGHNSKVCFTQTAGLLYSVSYANDQVVPVKSTNNGLTWSPLTGNPDNSEETFSIDVDYYNPNRIVISYYGAIYFSSNGGTSFSQIHTASTTSGNVVGGVFFDGNTIFIGTNDGVLVSTNGGSSFSVATISGLPANERIWSFAAGKSGSITRLFCITADVADIYVGVVGSDYYNFRKGVYSVDYGSGNWQPKITGLTANDFPMFIRMAENDINTIYMAGSNSNGVPTVYKTSNAGSNWTNVFITSNNQNIFTGWSGQGGDRGWGYGECAFGFEVAKTNSSILLFGDFGFVHRSTNGGTSWNQCYVDAADQHPANSNTPPNQSYHSIGIENTTCWQVHWINATNMWSCYSDIRGLRSTDGGNSWSFNYTGHAGNTSYRIVQHPSNGTLFAGSSNIHDMYQSTRLQDAILDANDANGKIIYSTNNGQTWQNLKVFNHPVFWIALDPNNANRAYASVIHYSGGTGVGGVYICNDLQNLATSTWTLLPNPPRTEKHPASLVVLNDGKLVATYSGRRNSSGTFTASSGVFIYDPGTNVWTDVSHTGMYYWTKDIVVDPNDPQQNTWYVGVFSGWGGPPNGLGGLYKTTNRGQSWTKISMAAGLDRVTSCTFNPNNANEIFVTTEAQGLWRSSNINAPVPTFSRVTEYPFQQPERVFFNPYNSNEMWVSSFGNGMKVAQLNPTGMISFSETPAILKLFPNPSEGIIHLIISEPSESLTISVYDGNGKKILQRELASSTCNLNFSESNNGIYYYQLLDEKSLIKASGKFIIRHN